MVFAVNLPAGVRDFEHAAYFRALKKQGVNIAAAPRVLVPVGGKRWLYAIANWADAEAFGTALR
jgi:hypothetical protein